MRVSGEIAKASRIPRQIKKVSLLASCRSHHTSNYTGGLTNAITEHSGLDGGSDKGQEVGKERLAWGRKSTLENKGHGWC